MRRPTSAPAMAIRTSTVVHAANVVIVRGLLGS
jgi:hypothetical protein